MISWLIVNADDLGESRVVNEATIELMAAGRISSATIMANGRDFPYLRGRISRLRGCSFGVHLNASQYPPLTPSSDLEPLLNGEGEMVRLGRPLPVKPALLRALYAEYCAQVEAVGSLGVEVSHLDSHHHVHTQAAIFPVLKAVQKRFGIRKIRLSKNLYLPQDCPSSRLMKKKVLYNWCVQRVYRTRTTQYFTEFSTFHGLLTSNSLPSGSSLEAMVHPGSAKFEGETKLLRSEWLHRLPPTTKLISYAELR